MQKGKRVSRVSRDLKKQLVLLVAEGLVVVLVVVMYFGMSLGWFNENKDVSGSGSQISSDSQTLFAKYTTYRYDVYTNDRVDDTGTLRDVHFFPYDKLFEMRNRYTSLLLRAELTGTALDPNGGTIYFTINRNPSCPATVPDPQGGSQPLLSSYASSIMRFTAAVDHGGGNPSAGGGTGLLPVASPTPTDGRNSEQQFAWLLYENLDKALYDRVQEFRGNNTTQEPLTNASGQTVGAMGDSKVFTRVIEQTMPDADPFAYRKADFLEVCVKYTADDLRVTPEGENCLNVFLFVSYDMPLVEHYWLYCADKQLDQGTGVGDNFVREIKMENDFTQMTVNIKTAESQPAQQ